MKIVSRKSIKNKTYREILDVEIHHDHKIVKHPDGTISWEENKKVMELVNKVGLDNLFKLFDELGHDKNSEIIRKIYRDIGCSLFVYWEAFYWETNNEIAHEYCPPKRINNYV